MSSSETQQPFLHASQHLPVFFFHGLTGSPGEAIHLEKALAAHGRTLVALSFSPAKKSIVSLHKQIPLAIAQIRSIVASDERFQHGYVFMGHSQGGMLARAVVEEMDDHQVHTLISLAGVQNGIFYGPQAEDLVAVEGLLAGFGEAVLPGKMIDFAKLREDQGSRIGRVQHEVAKVIVDHPELQEEYSFTNLQRLPSHDDFLTANTFLPVINNVNKCESSEDKLNQERRKRNFLKLQAAYFFMSPADGAVAPWQSSHFGRYSFVNSLDEIESKFDQFSIVPMRETEEYVDDTFGLRTLDERGSLFLVQVPDIPHCGWIADTPLTNDPTQLCKFQSVFDKHISLALP
jgi:palmitoyl-protein thioesterase